MFTRTLGRTGIEVSAVSLGGLFISQFGGERAQAVATIRRALERGINVFDTAPRYYDSEEVLGEALASVTTPHYVCTKLGERDAKFNPKDKAGLRRSVENSLRLLRRDHIDVLLIHEPDRSGQFDWWDDWESFHGPARELMDELKQEGLIRWSGLGGTTAYEMPRIMATGHFDVVLTAFNFSLLWREAAIAVLPEAERQGMGVMSGSPLQQGALARRFDDQIADGAPWMSPPRREQYGRLYALLDEIEIPLPELALRFVLSESRVHTAILGARSPDEVDAGADAAAKGPLPEELLTRLQAIAELVPFRPFEEPFGLPFTRAYKGPGPA